MSSAADAVGQKPGIVIGREFTRFEIGHILIRLGRATAQAGGVGRGQTVAHRTSVDRGRRWAKLAPPTAAAQIDGTLVGWPTCGC